MIYGHFKNAVYFETHRFVAQILKVNKVVMNRRIIGIMECLLKFAKPSVKSFCEFGNIELLSSHGSQAMRGMLKSLRTNI